MFLIINYQFVNAALNANAFQNLFECVSVEIDSIQIERESFQLNSGYMLRLEECLTSYFSYNLYPDIRKLQRFAMIVKLI